jgi:hypothetical protein
MACRTTSGIKGNRADPIHKRYGFYRGTLTIGLRLVWRHSAGGGGPWSKFPPIPVSGKLRLRIVNSTNS